MSFVTGYLNIEICCDFRILNAIHKWNHAVLKLTHTHVYIWYSANVYVIFMDLFVNTKMFSCSDVKMYSKWLKKSYILFTDFSEGKKNHFQSCLGPAETKASKKSPVVLWQVRQDALNNLPEDFFTKLKWCSFKSKGWSHHILILISKV